MATQEERDKFIEFATTGKATLIPLMAAAMQNIVLSKQQMQAFESAQALQIVDRLLETVKSKPQHKQAWMCLCGMLDGERHAGAGDLLQTYCASESFPPALSLIATGFTTAMMHGMTLYYSSFLESAMDCIEGQTRIRAHLGLQTSILQVIATTYKDTSHRVLGSLITILTVLTTKSCFEGDRAEPGDPTVIALRNFLSNGGLLTFTAILHYATALPAGPADITKRCILMWAEQICYAIARNAASLTDLDRALCNYDRNSKFRTHVLVYSLLSGVDPTYKVHAHRYALAYSAYVWSFEGRDWLQAFILHKPPHDKSAPTLLELVIRVGQESGDPARVECGWKAIQNWVTLVPLVKDCLRHAEIVPPPEFPLA